MNLFFILLLTRNITRELFFFLPFRKYPQVIFFFLRYTKNGELEIHILQVKQALIVTRVIQILFQLHYSGLETTRIWDSGRIRSRSGYWFTTSRLLDHHVMKCRILCWVLLLHVGKLFHLIVKLLRNEMNQLHF